MLSRIRTCPPKNCQECEFYDDTLDPKQGPSPVCALWRARANRHLKTCQLRAEMTRIQIRAGMEAAAQWIEAETYRRKLHVNPRKKPPVPRLPGL